MGLGGLLRKVFGGGSPDGLGLDELGRRLDLDPLDLGGFRPEYRRFEIPKRGGGRRTICAPDDATKEIQRRLLRRVLAGLSIHPCATGFTPGHSIVTNALPHVGRDVVVRFDIRDFFPSTGAARVAAYFRFVGWSREATDVLVRLTTHEGALPQGAPTSPRLANLLNVRLDARLFGYAAALGAAYTRYADDMTFSIAGPGAPRVGTLIRGVKSIVADEGYRLHTRTKLRIRRAHQRQTVTGLVVNEGVALPRETRRWLRAVEHRRRTRGGATLTDSQLRGWRALCHMIETQRS